MFITFILFKDNVGNIISLVDEPILIGNDKNALCFTTRIFVSGDLAFLSTMLGKENRSGYWCIWCKLFPSEWSVAGHAKGELWTLEAIKSIQHQVDTDVLSNIPQNIKGCTELPLLDSVPVSDYIVSVLHILIGMGNILVEVLLE
jgi:hypothetical protein